MSSASSKKCLRAIGLLLGLDLLLFLRATRLHWLNPSAAAPSMPTAVSTQRVYIAATLSNVDYASEWTASLLGLFTVLDPRNCYLSISIKGDTESAMAAISILNNSLPLNLSRDLRVESDDMFNLSRYNLEGSDLYAYQRFTTPHRRAASIRAKQRNRLLEPLRRLAKQGTYFDRVLMTDDVLFTVCQSFY